jgi:hypothetical protein
MNTPTPEGLPPMPAELRLAAERHAKGELANPPYVAYLLAWAAGEIERLEALLAQKCQALKQQAEAIEHAEREASARLLDDSGARLLAQKIRQRGAH